MNPIIVEEYHLLVSSPISLGKFDCLVRYVKHNGYTRATIENPYSDPFIDWYNSNQLFNTRYDKPHWWKPIRFNRGKKIERWANLSIEWCFASYKEHKKEQL